MVGSRLETVTALGLVGDVHQHAPAADGRLGDTDDVLVFERSDGGFRLIDGKGRGIGWAGIVDIADDEPTLVRRAWQSGVPVRISGRRSQRCVGPYHARNAVAVPVGDRHVVVFGSRRRIDVRDADLVGLAASTVDRSHGVPADKLLADELELVHTLRALMAYRPETVRDTLRHIATVAAGALSCEVAVIRVEQAGRATVEAFGLRHADVAWLETDGARRASVGSGSD